MDEDSIVSSALDIYADESTLKDEFGDVYFTLISLSNLCPPNFNRNPPIPFSFVLKFPAFTCSCLRGFKNQFVPLFMMGKHTNATSRSCAL